MVRSWIFAATLAGLATTAWAPVASAYVRTVTSAGAPMYWNRTVMKITAAVGDPPPALASEDIVRAVRGAAAAWSRDRISCTSLELQVDWTLERTAPVELDGQSRLTFRREQWCKEPRTADEPCYDPFALAVTSVFARKADGEIVDADIELNAVDFQWFDLSRPAPEGVVLQDLQNTLTHELGHFIGLDHTCFLTSVRAGTVDDRGHPVPSCGEANEEVRATTMFAAVIPGDLERRSLSPDDRRAVCDIYRPVDVLLEAAQPVGCAVAPRRSPAGAALPLLLGLVTWFRPGRRPARGWRSSTGPAPRR
jgi:hypothetical protein